MIINGREGELGDRGVSWVRITPQAVFCSGFFGLYLICFHNAELAQNGVVLYTVHNDSVET